MTGALHADVLVAGLGPAGACAAMQAARSGMSVVAIDRKADAGLPVQCAEFVPVNLGIEISDLSACCEQPVDSMVTFVEDEAGDTVEQFPGLMVDRQAFDARLAAQAAKAGVDCRFATALKSIEKDGRAMLSDGTHVKPKVIIGADGPRSRIGRAIGQTNEDIAETRQITVPLLKPLRSTDIFLSARLVGGYGWLFPKGDLANLGIGVAPRIKDQLKPLLDDLHRRLVAEGLVGQEVLRHTGGAIPVGGMVQAHGRIGDVPVFLAGDAAGLTNPITGAGINAAVQSGRLAGQYASELLAGDDMAQRDYREDLEDLFKPSLDRALSRRKALLQLHSAGKPDRRDLRRNWIAYPEYWAA